MSRTLRESPITTRSARASLPVGLYWRSIDPDIHLGYRKAKRGGTWLVRWRAGTGYIQKSLGTADDAIRVGTIDFHSATKIARQTVETARDEAKFVAEGPPITVRVVVSAYIADRDAICHRRMGRRVRSDASQRLSRYILGQAKRGKQNAISASPLSDKPLHQLTDVDLREWRTSLPETLKATSVQRLTNDLKAALNSGYEANRNRLPPTLPATIKRGLKANRKQVEPVEVARDNQILTDRQVARLVNAARDVDAEHNWHGDLFRLIVVLAASGARFSQIARMRVADCQPGRLLIPVSHKGNG